MPDVIDTRWNGVAWLCHCQMSIDYMHSSRMGACVVEHGCCGVLSGVRGRTSKNRVSQWAPAVAGPPWSSNSAPITSGQPKKSRTVSITCGDEIRRPPSGCEVDGKPWGYPAYLSNRALDTPCMHPQPASAAVLLHVQCTVTPQHSTAQHSAMKFSRWTQCMEVVVCGV